MKKVLSIVALLAVIIANTQLVKADELTVKIDINSGDSKVKIVGADVYAMVDDQLVEVTVSPDKLPFKANLKIGAFRLKSFWATNKQYTAQNEEVK